MQDWELQSLINRTRKTADKLRVLTQRCDAEYKNRMGVSPQDNQDDIWVGAVHLGEGEDKDSTVYELMAFANHRKQNPPR